MADKNSDESAEDVSAEDEASEDVDTSEGAEEDGPSEDGSAAEDAAGEAPDEEETNGGADASDEASEGDEAASDEGVDAEADGADDDDGAESTEADDGEDDAEGVFDDPGDETEEVEASEDDSDAADADEAGEGDDEGDDGDGEEADASTGEDGGQPSSTLEKEPASGLARIAGIFVPDREREAGLGETEFLTEEDLGEFETEQTNPMVWVLSLVVAGLVGVLGFVLFNRTKQGDRIVALFKGELKAYERAEAQRQREKFKQAQLSKLPQYGTLRLRGRPKYATVKLDGELQYGKLSHPPRERGEYDPRSGGKGSKKGKGKKGKNGGKKKKKKELPDKLKKAAGKGKKGGDGGSKTLITEWKPLRLTNKTEFQNLLVEEKHSVQVQAPGFRSKKWNLTKGMWNKVPGSDIRYEKRLQVDLVPESAKRMLEFEQRLKKDPETNYYGEITIETVPKGAKVIFDTYPLLDKEGKKMRTPVTFDKYYVENKKTGELEERKIKVDTPPDRGHKIQIRVPESKGSYPNYIQGLERQMWRCEWKEEAKGPGLPDSDKPLPKLCNYKYTVDVDFNGLKNFIRRKKKEKKELKKKHEKIRTELKEMRQKLKKL
ncbi:MAG: hypothetical protein ABEL76_08255 [Bradymonadaceae bacterium]